MQALKSPTSLLVYHVEHVRDMHGSFIILTLQIEYKRGGSRFGGDRKGTIPQITTHAAPPTDATSADATIKRKIEEEASSMYCPQ